MIPLAGGRSSRFTVGFTVATVFALFIQVSMPQVANAHAVADYYPHKWNATPLAPAVVRYEFGNLPSLGTNAATDEFASIEWGHQQWNARGQSLTFVTDGQENLVNWRPGCGQTFMDNWIYQRTIDGVGNILAETIFCYLNATGSGHSFSITFDGSESWYILDGDAPPTQIDLRSVATHEFGHAAGQTAHWDDNGDPMNLCLDSSAEETMCRFYYPGTERQRTLELHDGHTFDAAY